MKICIMGNTKGNIDEGMKKIAYNLAQVLSKNHDILLLSPNDYYKHTFWNLIRQFNPQIIHYIPGPSIKSFILLKIISIYLNESKIIMSSTLPHISNIPQRILYFFRPHLVLTTSEKSENLFKQIGVQTKFFPLSGVDTTKYIPLPKDKKELLRRKYNLDNNIYLVLHVGHIKQGRNLKILKNIQSMEGVQVVIIGSTSTNAEHDLFQDLVNCGCKIFSDYIEEINEIYAISDCYIFPVVDAINCIEYPLSVLEAMSCNLPIISSKFGALPRVFSSGVGFFFAEHDDNIMEIITLLRDNGVEIKTRELILSNSWSKIAENLIKIYISELSH